MLTLLLILAADAEPPTPPVKPLASAHWVEARWPAKVGGKGIAIRDAAALAEATGRSPKRDGPAAAKELAATLGVKAIDWKKEMVVAVLAGPKSCDGHRVEVTGFKVTKGTLTVSWRLHEPRGLATAVVEHPTAVILLPRFAGKVVFDPPLGK